MVQLAKKPFEVYYDINGMPLENGYLYFGAYGLNPETNPVQVYWDSGFTNIASQPIRTVNGYADLNGSPAKVYVPGNYSITIKNKRGELVASSLYEEVESTEAADGANNSYPYVISGLLPSPPVNGWTTRTATFPVGIAWVEGIRVEFPGQTITFPASTYTDVYLDKAGQIFIKSNATYWLLTEENDKAKICRVQTDASKITGLSDMRNRVTSDRVYVPEASLDFNKVLGDFDIPKTALSYAANTFFNYGAKVKIGDNLYICLQSGTTGAASAPSGYVGTTWDAGLQQFVFVDGSVKWYFIAEFDMQGAYRWGVNNGVVWYFSNLGIYYVLDRLSNTRVQEYVEAYIFNLITRWLSGVAIQKGMKRYINGNVYKCTVAGTTGVTAPSGTGTAIVDGTVTWKYIYPHVGEYVAWASGQAITAGQRRTSSGNIYQANTAGTTGATAPTGTSDSINDGGVTWSFLNPIGLFTTGADWYVHDVQTDRYTVRPADSHDAYAASFLRLVAQWLKIRNDYSWLNLTNVHGQTNLATLKNVAFANLARCQKTYTTWAVSTAYTRGIYREANGSVYLCVTSGTSASSGTGPSGTDPTVIINDGTCQWRYQYPLAQGLITTFQNELHSNTVDKWPVCYLQDNCENYSGLKAFSDMLAVIGDADTTYYGNIAAGVAVGVKGLYITTTKEWRFADNALTVNTAFYPDMMAAIFPELHQVPVGATPEITADLYGHGYEFVNRVFPSWWNRHPDTLASLVIAYVAVRFRQEPRKGAVALEHAMAHHLRQGLPQLGTFMFSDLCYAFAMRSMIVNPLATQGELSLWQGRARGNLEFTDDGVYDIGTANNRPRRAILREFVELQELAASPSQPAANRARLFIRDNGSGKTQLCILWPGNAVTVLSTEP